MSRYRLPRASVQAPMCYGTGSHVSRYKLPLCRGASRRATLTGGGEGHTLEFSCSRDFSWIRWSWPTLTASCATPFSWNLGSTPEGVITALSTGSSAAAAGSCGSSSRLCSNVAVWGSGLQV